MPDVDHFESRRWLNDDLLNTVFIVAAALLAVVLTSRLWIHIYASHHVDTAPSIVSAVFSVFHLYSSPNLTSPSPKPSPTVPESDSAVEQRDRKSTRTKERRRRGKDPFKDLLKGGKKSKALLKAIQTPDPHASLSTDALSKLTVPGNDTASSTSRSQSPEPPRGASDTASRTATDSDDSDACDTTPNANTFAASAVASDQGACSRTDIFPESMTAADAQVNVSSVSTVAGHASQDVRSSPRVPCADLRAPQPRDAEADSASGSCAKFVRSRTRLRMLKIDPTKASLLLSTPSDSVASLSPALHSILPPASLSATSCTHIDGAGPSTPTNSRGLTPPPPASSRPGDSDQGMHPSPAIAQTQIASMRDALEAACLREEQLRAAAEQANKQADELRWQWNEDASAWRMREAELQVQIHHLSHQLQAYAAVASFQAAPSSQPSSNFSSPTSPHVHLSPHSQYHPLASFPLPPPIQTQNSASAPAHVRALLAPAPMLTCHPQGFAAHAYSGMSPLAWSGLGLCVPNRELRHGGRRTPDSSASGSSSQGRRRRHSADNIRSASDESSLGDWDGIEDGSGEEDVWDEEQDDIFENHAVADAILKRPDSLRKLNGNAGRRSGVPSGGLRSERIDALKDPATVPLLAPA